MVKLKPATFSLWGTVCAKPCKDEAVVEVLSSLGQSVGAFCLPKSGLHYLAVLNGNKDFPYYFAWKTKGNKKGELSSPKSFVL